MGHRAGWLTLGAGIGGGADVILIPEIPYDVEKVAAAMRRRSRRHGNFSIVAVAEGAMSVDYAAAFAAATGASSGRARPRSARAQGGAARTRRQARRQHAAPGRSSSRS